MIKFFRKIRQNMIKENKVSKYFLYAIGEIILVVIGILIALQLNNRNEQKKTLDQVDAIVVRVLSELENNINETTILFYAEDRIDTVLALHLSNKWKEQQLKGINTDISSREIFSQVGNHQSISLAQNSYDQLVKNVDNLPVSYMSFYDELVELYGSDKRRLWEEQDIIFELEKEIFNKHSKLSFVRDRLTDEGINDETLKEYVLNNLDFKSQAYRWYSALGKQRRFAGYFRERAVKCYNLIHESLKIKDTTTNIWNTKGQAIAKIEGKYISKFNKTVSFDYVNNNLVFKTDNNSYNLHRYDSLSFALEDTYLKFSVKGDSIKAYIQEYNDGIPFAIKLLDND